MSPLINVPLFRLNPLAAGLNLSASLKADNSNKEMEEAMKRVREAQSLISAAIEPGSMYRKAVYCLPNSTGIQAFFTFVCVLFFCFTLQTKRARSALGLVRGPDPGGGGPDLAQGTGNDCRAGSLVVVLRRMDSSFHVPLQALQEPIQETLDLTKQEAFKKPAAETYPLS